MDAEFDIEGRNTSLSRTGNRSQGFSRIYGEYAVYANRINAMQVDTP